MRILISGICGFAGSSIARHLLERMEGVSVAGFDNFFRPGSEINRLALRRLGITVTHGDARAPSDIDALPEADWVIDSAAQPSVLAGLEGPSASRQLWEHNLIGTLHLLEYCRRRKAGLILISSSRVYSIAPLAALPVGVDGAAFRLDDTATLPAGVSSQGIAETFSTAAPVSLYGGTKLASETMALEYGHAFGFPVWITRCGVLAGPGQFGTAEQGIFSYWIHAHARRRPLRFIGFGGCGYQVRDALHPADLTELLCRQMSRGAPAGDALFNAGGGLSNSMSLAELTAWCDDRFGPHRPTADLRPRPYDLPWVVMDSRRALHALGWRPEHNLLSVLEAIAFHAEEHPDWLELCQV